MAELNPVLRKSLKTGLITKSAVADSDYPEDAMVESLNMHFDTIGEATLRKGITRIGNVYSANPVISMYQFNANNTTDSKLLAVFHGASSYITYYNSATDKWVGKEAITANEKVNFTTFLNYVFKVNPTDNTKVWDGKTGNSFVTTGNASGAPKGAYIENFISRVWIAGNTTYPDRLYYSSVPSAIVTPIITWDTDVTTGAWLDISPSDGENITALKKTKGFLLVFKKDHIYQVKSEESADADPKINVGTWSSESIVEAKNGVYFHHPTGFYQYANGSIQEISQPIIDIVGAITLANYSKVAGWLEPDGNHISWSVGDVTYGGITYSNVVVRYTISSAVWTHYSYPTQFLSSTIYNDGSNLHIVAGDESGNTYKVNEGINDDSTPVYFSLIHATDDIDGLDSTEKKIEKIYFSHSGGQGANINYRLPNIDGIHDWRKHICRLNEHDTGVNNANITGKKIQIRVQGTSVGEPFSYEGYEILKGNTQLVTFTNE